MENKEILKKKIIYRAFHRGSKEMDILLGNFVKTHIDDLNYDDSHAIAKHENKLQQKKKGLYCRRAIVNRYHAITSQYINLCL